MSFLVIEGLDGSGKSTQIKRLHNYLTSKHIPFKYIHFPRTDTRIYGELIARFLRGEFGKVDQVDPYMIALIYAGDRKDAEKLGVSGILRSGETTLRFGEMSYLSTAEKLPKHNIPVGDYLPLSLSVDVGTLTASFSQNYYATEAPYARVAEPAAGVTIQKDKPFVLGFGGKPVVIFTAPGQGQVFKPGDTVSLRAMMIDPKLNLLIRGLSDTTQKLSEQTYRISGQTVTVPRYAPLVPTVTITNSSGEQVAEGTMPFG